VSKPAPGEEFKVVGLNDQETQSVSEHLGRDIIFIKEDPGVLRPKAGYLYRDLRFWVLVVFVFLVWAAGLFVYRRTHRLQTDTVYARRLQAPKKAKRGLARARALLKPGGQKEFYDAIFKVLQDYFADKFHMAAGSVTVSAVEGVLKDKNIAPEILSKVCVVLGECDMVRFASAQLDETKMRSSYADTESIIDYLERHWR
jgi:hypothetical protein